MEDEFVNQYLTLLLNNSKESFVEILIHDVAEDISAIKDAGNYMLLMMEKADSTTGNSKLEDISTGIVRRSDRVLTRLKAASLYNEIQTKGDK